MILFMLGKLWNTQMLSKGLKNIGKRDKHIMFSNETFLFFKKK